jgi:hypothetical protein
LELLTLYATTFFFATFKFMFASSIMMSASDLSFIEIVIFSCLGGLFSFNVFFFSSSYFMHRYRTRMRSKTSVIRNKKNFTKMNKTIVRYKSSPYSLWLICILAPLFMSVPVGSIVVAKFYRHNKKAYFIVTGTLIISAIILASLSYLVIKVIII